VVLVAFGFKAAAAPFHLWAPDTYEGAPTPSAALLASASKLAGFTLFLRLLWPGLGALTGEVATAGHDGGWLTGVALLSGASLLLGKFAVFAVALKLGGIAGPAGWLTLLAIALSAVALYYYLSRNDAVGEPRINPNERKLQRKADGGFRLDSGSHFGEFLSSVP